MTVTLKDIAQNTGVSVQLVSAVVSGKAEQYRISKITRERVEEMAQQLGYDPENNRSARQMVARRNGIKIPNDVIAVCTVANATQTDSHDRMISAYDHPYEGDILHGIEAAASKVGMDVLICRHCKEKLPRLIERQEVDGVIVLTAGDPVMEQIATLKLPAVKLVASAAAFHNVSVANYQGIYDVVKHLAGLGHKNISFLGHLVAPEAGEAYAVSRERFAGYKAAMQECGLTSKNVSTSLSRQSIEAASEAMDELWKESQGKITAVVCYNDVLAMGAIRSLQKHGLNVPADVSVTGFDDTSKQYAFEPHITSVFYDRFKLGQRAVEILWDSRPYWLTGKKLNLVREVMPVELSLRESTAPPRTN